MPVGNCQNLNHVWQLPIHQHKRKALEYEFSSIVGVSLPALRRFRDKLDCFRYSVGETRGHEFVTLKVPIERGEKLTRRLLVELNVFADHVEEQRKSGLGLPAKEQFLPRRNPRSRRAAQSLLAKRLPRLGLERRRGCSRASQQGPRVLLP